MAWCFHRFMAGGPWDESIRTGKAAMKPSIRKSTETKEFYLSENCYITEWSNSEDDPDLSIAQARVRPGERTRLHRLSGTVERYCIISGRGMVEVGALPPTEVGPGDVVVIPAGCPQRIRNIGSGDLIFLVMCTPRFLNAVYEDLENGEKLPAKG